MPGTGPGGPQSWQVRNPRAVTAARKNAARSLRVLHRARPSSTLSRARPRRTGRTAGPNWSLPRTWAHPPASPTSCLALSLYQQAASLLEPHPTEKTISEAERLHELTSAFNNKPPLAPKDKGGGEPSPLNYREETNRYSESIIFYSSQVTYHLVSIKFWPLPSGKIHGANKRKGGND